LADSLAGIIRNRTHQGAAFPGHFLLLIIFTSIVITFPRLKKAFRDEGVRKTRRNKNYRVPSNKPRFQGSQAAQRQNLQQV